MKLHKFKHTENTIKGHNGILYEILPKQKNGFKYRLLEDYHFDTGVKIKKAVVCGFISLMTTGRMHMKAGFEWDGATCFPDIQSVMRASLEHDALYTLMILRLIDQKYVMVPDLLFRATCIADGMKKWLAMTAHGFLFILGWAHIKKCIDKQPKLPTTFKAEEVSKAVKVLSSAGTEINNE